MALWSDQVTACALETPWGQWSEHVMDSKLDDGKVYASELTMDLQMENSLAFWMVHSMEIWLDYLMDSMLASVME